MQSEAGTFGLAARARGVPTARALAAILLAGLVVRLAVLPLHGYEHDVKIFVGWAHILMRYGTHGLYGREEPFAHTAINYPPGYALQLLVVSELGRWLAPHAGSHADALLTALLKLPGILADLVLTGLTFAIVRRWGSTPMALAAAAIAAFAPWTWPVSAYWGQIDSLSALFLMLGFYAAICDRFALSWLALAAGILIKPFPIVVVPLLIALHIKREGFSARLLLGPALGVALAYVTSLPFAPSAAPRATFGWLAQQYTSGQALFPMTSVDAYNLWLVASPAVPDAQRALGLELHTWGWLGFIAFGLAVVLVFWRRLAANLEAVRRERTIALAWFLTLLGLFVVATRMHERYVIFALAFAPMLFVGPTWERRAAIVLTLTFTANVVLSLLYKHVAEIVFLTHTISLLNVATLIAMTVHFVAWNRRNEGEAVSAGSSDWFPTRAAGGTALRVGTPTLE